MQDTHTFQMARIVADLRFKIMILNYDLVN